MKRLRLFLTDLFGRDRFERQMRDELDAYLEMSAEAHRRRGLSDAEARRAAHLELGGVEQARERIRGERGGVVFDTVWQDVRYAFRMMQRQPGFTAVAVITLALGIGANTAVISVVRSVVLAPLPFADADRLVRLQILRTDSSGRERRLSLVPAYFAAIRERSRLIERMATQRFHNLTLMEDGTADRVIAIGVSDQWAETLGVRPFLGRSFSEGEQRDGSNARVVLLEHGFWRRRFGGDRDILGRSIRLDSESYVVIGVMPPQFRYPYEADLWFPISIPLTATSPDDLNTPARMKAGVTNAQLDAELASLADALAREFPLGTGTVRLSGTPLRMEFARDPNGAIAALAVAVALVLLLVCVNLAMLLLARGSSRAREMALRSAIGASGPRQIRQLLTESTLVAVVGGVGGVALAFGIGRWLGQLIPARLSEVIQDVQIDAATLAIALLITVTTGIVIGIVPALRLTDHGSADTLRDGGRPGGAAGRRLLNLLVGSEAALAMLLLASAAVMTQNFARLLAADIGYDTAGLVRINLGLNDPSYADARRRATVIGQVLERVQEVPGVTTAGVTSLQPIPRVSANFGTALQPDSIADPGAPRPVLNRRLVTPTYFETVGVRLIAGRGFADLDGDTSEPVVILNEAAAGRLWPGQDPIGRHVRFGSQGTAPWHTVVGIVSNMGEPNDVMRETVYQPYAQASGTMPSGMWVTTSVSLMVRVSLDRIGVIDGIRRAIREVDPALPLFDIADMETALAEPLSGQRLGATLFVVFGALGLTMAVLGTYGVVAFSIGRRVPEFGIRLALGAEPSALLRTVVTEGLLPVVIGLSAGVVAVLLLSPLLATAATEVNARDPVTLAGVALMLLVTATAACLAPALQVMRVDPVAALRRD